MLGLEAKGNVLRSLSYIGNNGHFPPSHRYVLEGGAGKVLIESQFSFQKILPLGEYAELEALLKSLVLKKPLHGEQSMFNLSTAQLPVCCRKAWSTREEARLTFLVQD